jgi:O-methyltransferase involved in polyketide biosynthesis
MNHLQDVSQTLYIPLISRIYVSKLFPEYFYDEKAMSLETAIPNEIIQNRPSEYFHIASVARYYSIDRIINNFIDTHKECNIINLGAGLETCYFRLNNQRALFYEIDNKKVIDKRHLLLGESHNEILISSDIFALNWTQSINRSLPTLLIASGVFQYYHQDIIIKFINNIQQIFPVGELIFDAMNEIGNKYANRYVKRYKSISAPMYFFLNDCKQFARQTSTTLISSAPFFTDARKILSKKLKFFTRIIMKIVDMKRRAFLVHLKL